MPICNYSKLVKLGDILQMTKSKLNIQFIAKTKFKKKAVELPISFGGAQRSGRHPERHCGQQINASFSTKYAANLQVSAQAFQIAWIGVRV
jgi:hypothetical protein